MIIATIKKGLTDSNLLFIIQAEISFYIDSFVECMNSKMKTFIRYQAPKNDTGNSALKEGCTVFISNLKVQNSDGTIILATTDSTSFKIINFGASMKINRNPSSLRDFATETRNSDSHNSLNRRGYDAQSLLGTVVCWYGEPDNVNTPKDQIISIEVLAGDSSGTLILLRLDVPVFMLSWYKSTWLATGKHIQICFPRISFVDSENDIVVCSRGDRTTIRSTNDDATCQALMGKGCCYTNYESILWRGKLRFQALRENSQSYFDERLQMLFSSKYKFSAQVCVTDILETDMNPFNVSDSTIRMVLLRVQSKTEKSCTLLSTHTSLLSPDFFLFYLKFVYFVYCVEIYSGQPNEPYFTYLIERVE